jgi:hypothetical protein
MRLLTYALLVLGSLALPTGAADTPTEAVLRELWAAAYPDGVTGGTANVDPVRLEAALEAARQLERRGGLWLLIKDPVFSDGREAPLVGALQSGLSVAAVSARDAAARERWQREEQAMLLRFLRDPRSVAAFKAAKEPQRVDSDYSIVSLMAYQSLPLPRAGLKGSGRLKPNEWWLQRDVFVADEPDAVVFLGGRPYAAAAALRKVGFVVQEAPGRVTARTAARRTGFPVVPEAALKPGAACRRGETVLVPLDGLVRAGALTLEVLDYCQIIRVRARE